LGDEPKKRRCPLIAAGRRADLDFSPVGRRIWS
jgi:hypothetical protein